MEGIMMHFLSSLLAFSLVAAGLFFIAQSAGLIIKAKSRASWTSPQDLVKAIIRKMSRPLAWVTVGALLGIPIGWNLHRPSDTKKLDNVLVLKVRPDGTLRASADGVEDFETATCTPNDFKQGEKFTYWKYQNRPGCKQMAGEGLGFHAVTDEASGKRIIFPTPEETADARR